MSSPGTIFVIGELEDLKGEALDVLLVHVLLGEDVVERDLLLLDGVHEVQEVLLRLVVAEPLDEGDPLLKGVELAVVAHHGVAPLELLCVLEEREDGLKRWWQLC